jgi:hypothetical protein
MHGAISARDKMGRSQAAMSATSRLSHDEREQTVLTDLDKNFPHFAGQSLTWSKVPEGGDPPDFLSPHQTGTLGLELIEWLDGEQMTAAKARELQRDQVRRVLASGWESEYKPKHFRAFLIIGSDRISRRDEAPLRKDFYAYAAEVDRTWLANPERTGNVYYASEFPGYPLLKKYFNVCFIGCESHGLCWIDAAGDGGPYDPAATVSALNAALSKKIADYSTSEQQAHLRTHNLTELNLLIHGGFNAFAYNTPSGSLSLEEIGQRGSAFYAVHPQRHVFNRIWLFNSLDSADDLNKLIGFPPGYGRVRWLAQLWPDFHVY